jgi:hypothetical protein
MRSTSTPAVCVFCAELIISSGVVCLLSAQQGHQITTRCWHCSPPVAVGCVRLPGCSISLATVFCSLVFPFFLFFTFEKLAREKDVSNIFLAFRICHACSSMHAGTITGYVSMVSCASSIDMWAVLPIASVAVLIAMSTRTFMVRMCPGVPVDTAVDHFVGGAVSLIMAGFFAAFASVSTNPGDHSHAPASLFYKADASLLAVQLLALTSLTLLGAFSGALLYLVFLLGGSILGGPFISSRHAQVPTSVRSPPVILQALLSLLLPSSCCRCAQSLPEDVLTLHQLCHIPHVWF